MMILSLILFYNLFRKNAERLTAYGYSIATWNLIMLLGLEVLSVWNLVAFVPVLCFWCVVDLILFILLIIRRGERKQQKVFLFKQMGKQFLGLLSPLSVILFLIGIITFTLALVTAPNNWDSMTYHLPRIMHWAQNQSVAHYASNSVRQVASPVLSEFVNLYVYILCNKQDMLFNMLQWSAYITCTIYLRGICRKLGCNQFLSNLAGLLFMTLPIAFAESMTTQNDLFTSMWLIIFVYLILDLFSCEQLSFKQHWHICVVLSMCIAFGYLTKPSIMFGIVIFLVGLLITVIKRKDSLFTIFRLASCSVVALVTIILPELIRNWYSFHSITAPIAGPRQLVGTLDLRYLLIDFLKNFMQNIPNRYFSKTEAFFEHCVFYMAYLLRVDINARSIAEDGSKFFLYEYNTYHHDTAVNPVIWWSVLIGTICLLLSFKKVRLDKLKAKYVLCSILSFFMLCIFLRWERFVTRYMIAYLALLCPVVVLIIHTFIEKATEKKKKYCYASVGILIFVSIVELYNISVYHYTASEWAGGNRDVEYLHQYDEGKYSAYQDIVQQIEAENYKSVGIMSSEDAYEYPLWAMLQDETIILQHISIENVTQKNENAEFIPECIFVNAREVTGTSFRYHETEYVKSNIGDDTTYLMIKK